MNQPDLTVTFKGMEEAKPGQACYDPAQPWFAYVLINNCKFIDKEKGIADAKNPTGPSAPPKASAPPPWRRRQLSIWPEAI